jgi:hypothetical protein
VVVHIDETRHDDLAMAVEHRCVTGAQVLTDGTNPIMVNKHIHVLKAAKWSFTEFWIQREHKCGVANQDPAGAVKIR